MPKFAAITWGIALCSAPVLQVLQKASRSKGAVIGELAGLGMGLPISRLLAIGFFASYCSAADLSAAFGSYKRYLDEPTSATYGGSIRISLARRWSVRPEVLVDNGRNFSNVLALGSVLFDFTDPHKRAVGYAIFSAGTVQTMEQRITFSASRWLGAGGFGVRFALSERWIAGAEIRVGMPAFPLITFNLGYRWGRR